MTLTKDAAFKDLLAHVEQHEKKTLQLKDLFLQDPNRFGKYRYCLLLVFYRDFLTRILFFRAKMMYRIFGMGALLHP